MQIKTTVICYFMSVKRLSSKNMKENCRSGWKEKGVHSLLVGLYTTKNGMEVLQKIKIKPAHDSVMSLLGIHTKKKSHPKLLFRGLRHGSNLSCP